MKLHNHTALTGISWSTLASQPEQELGNALLKAAYWIEAQGDGFVLQAAETPSELVVSDQFFGEAGSSSVRWASDLSPLKPTTDITANATAFSPDGRPHSFWQAGIQLAEQPPAMLNVYGPRNWHNLLVTPLFTLAKSCTQVPIRYELAFGGSAPEVKKYSAYNPVGCGLFAVGKATGNRQIHQLEWQGQSIDEINTHSGKPAAGFGVRHRSWQPRLGYAGTYDDAWVAEQHPRPPHDFDDRFRLGGCEQLRPAHYLQGGERLRFFNLSPAHPQAELIIPKRQFIWQSQPPKAPIEQGQMQLDTLHLDIEQGLDGGQLTLIWRAQWPLQHPNSSVHLREVTTAPASAAPTKKEMHHG